MKSRGLLLLLNSQGLFAVMKPAISSHVAHLAGLGGGFFLFSI